MTQDEFVYPTDATLFPLTPNIKSVLHRMEEAIQRWAQAIHYFVWPVPEYEADLESMGLIWFIVRQIESMVTLARRDLACLPSAIPIARVSMESAGWAAWLLEPSEPFDREVRWLARVRKDEQYHREVAALQQRLGIVDDYHTKCALEIQHWRETIEAKLPRGYKEKIKGLPPFRNMLDSMGMERSYLQYKTLSQWTHGTQYAINAEKSQNYPGEAPYESQYRAVQIAWRLPLLTSSNSLIVAGQRFLETHRGNIDVFSPPDFYNDLFHKIDRI